MINSFSLFKPTRVQEQALKLLKGSAKHILLFGGSRSGKTSLLVMCIIFRATMYKGSRHLICRYRAKDARSSVLHETVLPWLDKTIGASRYKVNIHEGSVRLWNGSEIWIGGLGDKEQVDKILGHEYNTIYFNEVSQLTYSAVTTAYSRLAMNIPGCKNKFFYDCNPSSPMHWAYKVFIRKIEPRTDERLKKPELYASMILNPADNAENLADDYITDILDNLPGKQRDRFKDGLWVKSDGVVYDRFDESMIVSPDDLPKEFTYFTGGQDFGLNIAAVKIGWIDDAAYVIADAGGFNITTRTFVETQESKNWYKETFPTYSDPAGGERIQEIPGGIKANNSVDAGIDYVSALMERKKFFVSRDCRGVLGEIWDYMRDEQNKIVKVNDHYMDAMRYAIFSNATNSIVMC
jgi:PBSX family phage terminase large subunit